MQCIFCLQHASINLYIYSFSSDILKVYFKLNSTSGVHGYLSIYTVGHFEFGKLHEILFVI